MSVLSPGAVCERRRVTKPAEVWEGPDHCRADLTPMKGWVSLADPHIQKYTVCEMVLYSHRASLGF